MKRLQAKNIQCSNPAAKPHSGVIVYLYLYAAVWRGALNGVDGLFFL
jgi:hypothetical protein